MSEEFNAKDRAVGLALWSKRKGFEAFRNPMMDYYKSGKWMQKILPDEIKAMVDAGHITLQPGKMVDCIKRGMPSRRWEPSRYVFSDEIVTASKTRQKSYDEAMVD